MTDGWRFTKDVHKMLTMPNRNHFFDAENRMKVCCFIDKYVTRMYGSTCAVSTWFAKNEGKTIFDLITMSDIAYTVAVIRNGHETWDEMMNTSKRQNSPKKTTKFTKRGGHRREYNTTGWSQEGIDFYNKVWEGWKTLSRENRLQLWKQLENEWFEHVEETRGSQKRRKKHKTNLEEEDVDPAPNFPRLPTGMVFFGDDDYQPDRPWKNSGDDRVDDNTNEWDDTDSRGESLRINWVSLDGDTTEV